MIAMQEALFRKIGDFSGVAAETASWVVAMNARAIRDILLDRPHYPPSAVDQDRWIGYVGALNDAGKEKKVFSNVSGTLDDVLKTIRDSGDHHGRLLLLNADAVLRGVQARAKKELKIDFIASALASLSD
ncbi:hypothetical protein [Bradyrhizobium diazoefficiens]|uniref:hypothetical protein n=1 Tax=Bradyrhizobium diazoefficiens TaxID=1355477 RepID=UPI003475A2EC